MTYDIVLVIESFVQNTFQQIKMVQKTIFANKVVDENGFTDT